MRRMPRPSASAGESSAPLLPGGRILLAFEASAGSHYPCRDGRGFPLLAKEGELDDS